MTSENPASQNPATNDKHFEAGIQVRREVMGDEFVDAALSAMKVAQEVLVAELGPLEDYVRGSSRHSTVSSLVPGVSPRSALATRSTRNA